LYIFLYSFSLSSFVDYRGLHSFPTRRSSDLYDDMYNISGLEIKSHPLFLNSDVIHLHNTYGRYFSTFELPRLTSMKPFIKTMHRSEEHTSELQSRENLVCRLLLEKKKKKKIT